MVINTNVEAQRTASNLMVSQKQMAKSLARLSSGSKIVTASDDAAGLAVSSRLDSQLRRLDSVLNNLGNAMSLTQTQDGYLSNIDNALTRMTELAMMAQDNTKQGDDLALYNEEFQQLMSYVRSTFNKDFNGVPLFDGSYVDVVIDAHGGTFPVGGIDLGASVYASALKQQEWQLTSPAWATSKSGYVLNQDSQQLTGDAFKLTSDLWHNAGTWATSDNGGTKYSADSFIVNDGSAIVTDPPPQYSQKFSAGSFTTEDLTDPAVGNGFFEEFVDTSPADGIHDGSKEAIYKYALGAFVSTEPVGDGDLNNQHRTAVGKGHFVTIDPGGQDPTATAYGSGTSVTTQQDLSNFATDKGGVKITTVEAAKDALTKIMDALDRLHLDRASLGAIQSRIDFTSQQLTTSKQNLSQARSRITDVDIAEETTEFASKQILVQAGTQMLREANNLPRTALELLR